MLSVSGYGIFFSFLRTTYGGDGTTTFALPDFRGRVPIGAGTNPANNEVIAVGRKTDLADAFGAYTAATVPANAATGQTKVDINTPINIPARLSVLFVICYEGEVPSDK